MSEAPSLEFERNLWRSGKRLVAGVDEVGRGPLAGPVVAAACILPPYVTMIAGVRDSKLLTAAQREALLPAILAQATAVGIGAASVAEIERLNILRASHLAMRRALARVGPHDHALIDGLPVKSCDLGPHTAIVDGDALCYAIACASIVAKVTRDRLMRRLARHYPHYGWEHNAGYYTQDHLNAMSHNGLTPFHRRTWAPVKAVLESETLSLGTPPHKRHRPHPSTVREERSIAAMRIGR